MCPGGGERECNKWGRRVAAKGHWVLSIKACTTRIVLKHANVDNASCQHKKKLWNMGAFYHWLCVLKPVKTGGLPSAVLDPFIVSVVGFLFGAQFLHSRKKFF